MDSESRARTPCRKLNVKTVSARSSPVVGNCSSPVDLEKRMKYLFSKDRIPPVFVDDIVDDCVVCSTPLPAHQLIVNLLVGDVSVTCTACDTEIVMKKVYHRKR